MAERETSTSMGRDVLGKLNEVGRFVLGSFDLEGLVGAVAAWLAGMLLGALWKPLFWLGVIAAVLILLATRRRPRTTPEAPNLVLAPCDGIVADITRMIPPSELRIGSEERLRVRIASSIATTNPLYAPVTGGVSSIVMEEPNPSVWMAHAPETPGLAIAYIAFESLAEAVGIMVSTGGLGPRLDVSAEAGDVVKAGRVIGKRRLGGWCDIYLAADARPLVRAGQTLIGAETVLCRLQRDDAALDPEFADEAEADAEPQLEDVADTPDASIDTLVSEDDDTDVEPDERAAQLFQKLKAEAERGQGD